MLKFPYGTCDFYDIITDRYFYIDRTDRIRLIEEAGKHLLFLRPRRFGKSLLLSMLENYYDVAKAGEFETLFGRLAIGATPTAKHHQYFVLKWDFSVVDPQGSPEDLKRALHRYVNSRIEKFAAYYRALLPEKIRIDPIDATASLQALLTVIQQTPHRLYLLIDEYDNFANELMMGSRPVSPERYQALLYGEGALKTLFKAVKAAGAGEGLDRVFITGVSPIALSDITSGYNVAKSVYFEPEFNDLCGFTEAEIAACLTRIVRERGLPEAKAAEALAMMRTFYNGYVFAPDLQASIYNPTLALYFLEHFQKHGQYPGEMLDSNLALDRGKITYISGLPNGEQVILQALDAARPLSIDRLAHRFGVEDMLTTDQDQTFIASLLYYFGVLTLCGRTSLGKLALTIPNLVVRHLYVERLAEMLLPNAGKEAISKLAETFYSTGDLQPVCEFIEQRYFKVFDNRDYRWANELTIKTAFLTLLFQDAFYIMDSEPALTREYADLIMLVRPDMRAYQLLDLLLEFKYVSLPEVGLSGAEVRQRSRAELAALAPVQAKIAPARTKLAGYRRTLETVYGERLRLHTYSVVAVGFERVVWEEIP